MSALDDLAAAAADDFCYLTTRGRTTGEPHEIEIWFAVAGPADGGGATLFMLSGGRDGSDWVRNLRADPAVTVRVRDVIYEATARVVMPGTDEDERARTLVFEKYEAGYSGSLASWRESALPVALDVRG